MSKRISDLTPATTWNADDEYEANSSGAAPSKKVLASDLARVANPRGYAAGAYDFQYDSFTITNGTGWYRLAKLADGTTFSETRGKLSVIFNQAGNRSGTMAAEFGLDETSTGTAARNAFMELRPPTGFGSSVAQQGILSFGMAFSQSVNNAGAYLLAYLDDNSVGSMEIGVALTESFATNGEAGFELMTPELVSSFPTTCPDGSAATFLEAGAIWYMNAVTGTWPTGATALKVSDDQVNVLVPWGQTPKQNATTITINYGSSSTRLRFAAGSILLDATYTEGAPYINGERVEFILTKVGAFTAMTTSDHGFITNGNDVGSNIELS